MDNLSTWINIFYYCDENTLKNLSRSCKRLHKIITDDIFLHTKCVYGWDNDTCWKIACHGKIDLLRYANYNGCAMDERTGIAAALFGHVNCLEYYCSKFKITQSIMDAACYGGSMNCVMWCEINGIALDYKLFSEAFRNNYNPLCKTI